MIDGIRINCNITNHFEEIISNKNIDWETQTNIHTGETERSYTADFNGLKLEIKRGQNIYLIIAGSIHKYWHSGKNFSQFDYSELSDALHSLSNNLKIGLDKFRITRIEFGVNLRIEKPPFNYYYDFILHRKLPFQEINNTATTKKLEGVTCLHKQVAIKCYDKGCQYNIPYPLMRFEIKVTKMQYLKKVGLKNLVASDLLDKGILETFGELLVNVYAEIFKAQQVQLKRVKGKRLSEKDKQLMIEGNSPIYWMKVKGEGKKAYDQNMRRFKLLQKRHGVESEKHKDILLLIKSTVTRLLESNVKIAANLPRAVAI